MLGANAPGTCDIEISYNVRKAGRGAMEARLEAPAANRPLRRYHGSNRFHRPRVGRRQSYVDRVPSPANVLGQVPAGLPDAPLNRRRRQRLLGRAANQHFVKDLAAALPEDSLQLGQFHLVEVLRQDRPDDNLARERKAVIRGGRGIEEANVAVPGADESYAVPRIVAVELAATKWVEVRAGKLVLPPAIGPLLPEEVLTHGVRASERDEDMQALELVIRSEERRVG